MSAGVSKLDRWGLAVWAAPVAFPFLGSFVNLGNAISEQLIDTSWSDNMSRTLNRLAAEQQQADEKAKAEETARAKKALEDQKAEYERFEKSIFDLKNRYTVAHQNSRIALYEQNQNDEMAIGARPRWIWRSSCGTA